MAQTLGYACELDRGYQLPSDAKIGGPMIRFPRSSQIILAVCLSLFASVFASSAAAQTKLLRFPAIFHDKVAFTYAGDIWIAPATGGTATRLTAHPGVEVFARFSPDGNWIAFTGQYDGDEQVYVMSGEEELYVISEDGPGKPEQLTTGGHAMRYQPEWSPDSRRIAFGDKDGKVFVYSFDDKKLSQIVDAPHGQVGDYVWSPRGHYLSFSMDGPNNFGTIYIWSEKDGQLHRITDPMFNCSNPAWDPEGNYLFYLSDREFAPQLSTVEFNCATNRTTDIYALALRKDVKHPFPPESDEVSTGEKPDAAKAAPVKPDEAKPADMSIYFDKLALRVARVPISADNY
jgi:tricorn protease